MNDKLYEKKIRSKQIFNGKIVGLYFDDVELPNGRNATREKVTHPGAVGIVPITASKKIILVKQYRYPVQEITIEIPAGKLDRGEIPKSCARRELEEEVGAVEGRLIHLSTFFTTPGFCNEILYLYLAIEFEKRSNNLDDDEFLEILEIDITKALKWITEGKIKDSKTIIGILMAKDFLNEKYSRDY